MQCAIYGSFSGPKTQEIVVSRGNLLELLRPDENGKMQIICSTSVFGVIRALSPFSLAGTGGKEKQYIIIAGDSGRIVILEYNKDRNIFAKIHQETFGKSGCRRIVPGQYMAIDPRGRACMIGAVEKQKLVYVLNRDAAAKLTISSPLEAHKSHNIVFSICGLDNGFENPIFATIELDYADTDQVSGDLHRAAEVYTINCSPERQRDSPWMHDRSSCPTGLWVCVVPQCSESSRLIVMVQCLETRCPEHQQTSSVNV